MCGTSGKQGNRTQGRRINGSLSGVRDCPSHGRARRGSKLLFTKLWSIDFQQSVISVIGKGSSGVSGNVRANLSRAIHNELC